MTTHSQCSKLAAETLSLHELKKRTKAYTYTGVQNLTLEAQHQYLVCKDAAANHD